MSDHSSYQVGAAYRDITPTQAEFDTGSLYLWGFGSRAEHVTSTRTETDRLRVTSLAISTATETVILLALDVGALSEAMTAQIRSGVATNHGIPAEHVCINVSHTHAAPTVVSMPAWQAGVDTAHPGYVARIIAAAIGCVADSLEARRPAQLSFGRGSTQVGATRNNGAAGYDPTLDVIVAKAGEATIATVFSLACHPVLVSANVVSSDYPGVTRALVEQAYGGVAMFLQGFAGQTDPRSGLGAVDAVGQHLYNDVDGVLRGPLVTLAGSLLGRRAMTQLPLVELPASWKDNLPNDALVTRWKAVIESQVASGTSGTLPTEVQTFRIGQGESQLRVLASSHEVTCDLGVALREMLPVERTTTLAYCNIQCCYLPSKAVLQAGDVRATWPRPEVDNYEGGQSSFWYGHRAPLTDAAVDQYFDAFRALVDDPWTEMGHAQSVTAMAAADETLYVTTSNGILWSRPATGGDRPWTNVGAAAGIVGLAVIDGNLFAATEQGKLVTRPIHRIHAAWTEIGDAESVRTMTAHRGQLYVVTSGNTLWVRAPVMTNIVWTNGGAAESVAEIASVRGRMIAATTQGDLVWRQPTGTWMRFGRAENVVGMSALGSTLFIATSNGKLWRRDI